MGIAMRHPDIHTYPSVFAEAGGYPEAVDETQAQIWEANGWVRVTDDDTDLHALSMADLRRLIEEAQAAGREVAPAGRTKADLVAALEADRAATRDASPETFQGP